MNSHSGGVWAADTERLWNPKLEPRLPSESDTTEIIDEFMNRHDLTQRSRAKGPFEVVKSNGGGTYVAQVENDQKRYERQHASYL